VNQELVPSQLVRRISHCLRDGHYILNHEYGPRNQSIRFCLLNLASQN
jgi:hypothetical protein